MKLDRRANLTHCEFGFNEERYWNNEFEYDDSFLIKHGNDTVVSLLHDKELSYTKPVLICGRSYAGLVREFLEKDSPSCLAHPVCCTPSVSNDSCFVH